MISTEEQEQLQQTIEMFEVIVQASPQDCQSMEILKDAYNRLGKTVEGMGIAKKLAETYVELGQYSQAIIEYEGILHRDPNNVEIIAALGEVEERLQKSGQTRPATSSTPAPVTLEASTINLNIDMPVPAGETGTLMTTKETLHADDGSGVERPAAQLTFSDDGNDALARFLVIHRIVPEEIVASALERVTKKNEVRAPGTLAVSLIDEMCRRGAVELETLLSGIIDRSKFAYIPLEYYDVDRAVVKMLPEEITLGRLIVPFDVMSRTLMVAMANPFDASGKEAVQQVLDYNLQWHLASPAAISKALTEAYRISPNAQNGASSGGLGGGAPLPDTTGMRLA